jgi:putative membrane protein
MQSIRFQNTIKALLLIGLGLFLYSRLMNGTLFYYINERFMGFTILAVVGLLVVGLSYRYSNPTGKQAEHHHQEHDHEHDHSHDHAHNGAEHGHSHGLSWGGAFLVALPVVLGLLTPPQPLGSAALTNRDMNLQLSNSSPRVTASSAVVRPREKAATDKNILDWWRDFRPLPDANTALAGQAVKVSGFVYKDEQYGADTFLVIRFTVSCCVADAAVVGLLVQSPDSQSLTNDTWVEVTGSFVNSTLDNWKLPIVAAQQVSRIDIPSQPYLYP